VYAGEGISGKDIDGRPAVRKLIADIESGKINLDGDYSFTKIAKVVLRFQNDTNILFEIWFISLNNKITEAYVT
jgi:hypothetical protein